MEVGLTKDTIVISGSWIGRLIDDFIGTVLSVPFSPYHFVRAILSNAILSVYHFVHTILSVPFCPYHFVRYHFVLESMSDIVLHPRNLYKPVL